MKTTFTIMIILLSACRQNVDNTNLNFKKDFPFPFVLDSLAYTDKTFKASEMQVPINEIIYVGILSDTINLSKYDRTNHDNYLDFIDYHGNHLDFIDYQASSINKNNLSVFVSTKQSLTIDLENYSPPPPPEFIENSSELELDRIATAKTLYEWEKRPRNYIQAISVFIYNPSKDIVYLDQQDGRVLMIQEAKDENGVWKPIEYWSYSWCGNSYGAKKLLPNFLAVVKVFKYYGDFETEIRLKLKNGDNITYSGSFKGSINKSQFDLPGEYKEIDLTKEVEHKEYLDRLFLNK